MRSGTIEKNEKNDERSEKNEKSGNGTNEMSGSRSEAVLGERC